LNAKVNICARTTLTSGRLILYVLKAWYYGDEIPVLYTTVVLKRVPLGSLREKFLFPGRKFFQGGIGEEKLQMKKPFTFLLFAYLTHKTAQRGWYRWECLQHPWKSCFNWRDWHYKIACLVHKHLLLLHSRYCENFAIMFVIFVGKELTVFGFVRGEYEKSLKNRWSRR